MRVRFISGQRLSFTCTRCNAKRKGRVYRDCWEWRVRFELCGHEKSLGTVRPQEVLEEEGLVEG